MKKLLLLAVIAVFLPGVHAQEPEATQAQDPQANTTEPAAPAAPSGDAMPAGEPVTDATSPAPDAPPPDSAGEMPATATAPAEAAPEPAAVEPVGSVIDTLAVPDLAPPEAVSVSSGGDDPARLDEVVVTAQKTKQSARRVPVSISAFDGEKIKQTGAASLADLSLYVPNVRMDAHDLGSPQVFIRGFGTNAFNPSFEGSVGLVQDEIYFGRPGYFTEAMFDIDRVEVLRGPQGTLFGKNTIAGVFNITSKGPDTDLGADGSVYYGNHNEQRYEGGAGGMFNDWFGARVAGYYQTRGGQLYNTKTDRYEDAVEQKAGRVKLRFVPAYNFTSELTAVKSQTDAPFWPYQLFALDDDTRAYLRGFDRNVEDDPFNYQTSFETLGTIDKGSDTVSLKNEWNAGEFAGIQDFTPVLVLGLSKFHIDQLNELDVSPADIARLDSHERHKQRSAELRFTGHADSLFGFGDEVEFVAGGFYFESEYSLLARVLGGADLASYVLTRDACQLLLSGRNLPIGGCDALGTVGLPGLALLQLAGGPVLNGDYYQFDYTQKILSKALFGQLTWNLGEHFAITPGLRFSQETKQVTAMGAGHCQAPPACLTENLIGANDYPDAQNGESPYHTRSESDVSPKLALQFFSPSGINYYASYAAGFKSGGFNAISLTGDKLEYEPERARTIELGGKARLLDGTLGVNLTLYQTRFDNLQVLAFNGLLFDVSNAASARSRGVEGDFSWITPYAPLRINGSFGLLDARYLDYPGAPAPVRDSEGNYQLGAKTNLAGRRIAFAPKSNATLTPMLSYPVGSLMMTFAVDVIWQGDQYTDTDLDPHTYVGGYTKYAARLILGSLDQLWSVSIGGVNLSDKRVLNQVVDATFFPGSYFAQQAAGRQLFAAITFKL